MSKMSDATSIPKEVMHKVFIRDDHRCIVCGRFIRYDEETDTYYGGGPFAHYIRRSQGGLGIEENIVTLCNECHHDFDNGFKRQEIGAWVSEYLEKFYPDFKDEDRVYSKYKWLYKWED